MAKSKSSKRKSVAVENLTPEERVERGTFVLNLTINTIRTYAKVKGDKVEKMAEALRFSDPTTPAEMPNGAKELHVSKDLLRVKEVSDLIMELENTRWLLRVNALPVKFLKGGLYLYPATKVEWVGVKVRESQVRIDTLLSALEAKWNEVLKEDERRLSPLGLFDPADYPTLAAIRSATRLQFSWMRFSVPTELANINQSVFEAEREKANGMWSEMVEQMRLSWATTLEDFVSRLKAALIPGEDGKKRVLKQAVVENAKQFLSGYRPQDVTGFEELAVLVDKAKAALEGVDAEVLRTEKNASDRVASTMREISFALGPLVIEQQRRVRLKD